MASRARPQVMVLLEAWGDLERPEELNIVAMNWKVDFQKKQLAHQ